MSVAIRVEALGKQYRLGRPPARYNTLGDTLSAAGPKLVAWLAGRRQAVATPQLWALNHVSFDVACGEVVGVIGRNGAGKTTLLKVLSRITEPTEGSARLTGRVASLLEVGTGFHPELTGRENVYLNGAIIGMRRAEIRRKFDEIVAFAEVDRFIDTPVKRYSSGMYIRLAFAVAAHLEPEILLVDEVLAVGDVEFQKKCLGKMGEIGRQGRTVIIVSHNLASIVNLCQRAILLSAGRVAAEGKPRDVVQEYLATTRVRGGELTWPDTDSAPGNEIVSLHAAAILQEGCKGPTGDVDICKDVLIQLDYRVHEPGAQLYAAIWLRDQMGTPVLASSNAHSISLTEDPWYGRPHHRGLYRSVCRIPGNFLNEGLYTVSVMVGRPPSRTLAFEDYALSFHVHDTGSMRQEFYGGWIGTVRPRLAWRTEHVNAAVRSAMTDHDATEAHQRQQVS